MGEKMSAESNATRNQTGNISSAVNNVTQSANSTMPAVGKNLTDTGGTLLNKTGEVAKKIVGGASGCPRKYYWRNQARNRSQIDSARVQYHLNAK